MSLTTDPVSEMATTAVQVHQSGTATKEASHGLSCLLRDATYSAVLPRQVVRPSVRLSVGDVEVL